MFEELICEGTLLHLSLQELFTVTFDPLVSFDFTLFPQSPLYISRLGISIILSPQTHLQMTVLEVSYIYSLTADQVLQSRRTMRFLNPLQTHSEHYHSPHLH